MCAEHEVVLLWSIPRPDEAEVSRLRELLYSRLDWTTVLGLLVAHRTMGVAWHTTLRHLIEDRHTMPATYLLKGMEVMYKGQRLMAEDQIHYTLELLAALDAADIPSVVLKGSSVASSVYPTPAMRVFNDNDVLVPRDRLTQAGAVLNSLGYGQGTWDYARGRVRPARRGDVVRFAVTSHQTHPFDRPTPDARTLECHRVDLHFSVDLMTPNRTDAVVDDFLARRVAVGTDPLWALDPVDMFIFGCVHFYAEATHHAEVVRHKDLVLYKLIDLLAMLDGPVGVDPGPLATRVKAGGFERPVYYALAFLAALYPYRVAPELLAAVEPPSTDYLDEVKGSDGASYRWTVPMPERMFDVHRIDLLTV